MADIKVLEQEQTEDIEIKEPGEGVSAPVKPEIMKLAVEDAMGLENAEEKYRYKEKVETLLEYVKTQTNDWSPESIKWVIRSLELKLGTPPFSEKRINYVAQYAWLCMETQRLAEEKEKFTKGWS